MATLRLRGINTVTGQLQEVSSGDAIENGTPNIITQFGFYTVTATDHTIILDVSSSHNLILLPAADYTGGIVVIKRIDASANITTIFPDGSETIDGLASYGISTQYESITIQSDGSNWHIIGKYL